MLKIVLFVVALAAGSLADSPAPTKVVCGVVPLETIFSCIHQIPTYPNVISDEVHEKCKTSQSQLVDVQKCSLREIGWSDGTKINKTKASSYFDEFLAANPIWTLAVNKMKTACLGEDLPALTPVLNCPECDLMHCVASTFVKNIDPSQWKEGEECVYARAYSEACPVCPNECFGKLVPAESCNACKL